MHQRTITGLFALALAVSALACRGGRTDRAYRLLTGGTKDRGHQVILMKNCGSCHTIPGIRGARGQVGPPLTLFAERSYIAGELPNTPDNVVKWVRSPQSVEPKTAMPNLGLSDQQARDVAAYLYTLR
jgi:cytochrome c1